MQARQRMVPKETTPRDRFRRWVAAVLAVGAAALVTVSQVTGHPARCQETVANVGPDAVVRLCGPMSVADLVPVALVLLVLLWPDISQLEAFGWSVTKTKRDMAERSDARSANWPGIGESVDEKARSLLGQGSETAPPDESPSGASPAS